MQYRAGGGRLDYLDWLNQNNQVVDYGNPLDRNRTGGGADAVGGGVTDVDVTNPYPRNRYSSNAWGWTGSSYRPPKEQQYESTFGGISAVNPQSDMDVQGYIDDTYAAMMNRLDPVFEQQNDAWQQAMINRGIPVGGEAFGESMRDLNQTQNDARTEAMMQAMGFGAGLQQQNFAQDATRSSLANAMLQSKWGNQLGWGQLGLGYDSLNQRASEFGDQMGYNYAALDERGRQFDEGMDFGYFNADRDDMRWLTEFDRQLNLDQENNNRWSDQMGMSFLNPWQPGGVNVGPLNSNYLPWAQYYGDSADRTNNWWDAIYRWGQDNGYWGG
jgi:hypothetical protein